AAGGNVTLFRVDSVSKRVVYIADQETNDTFELWSVPIAGGTPIKLNGPLVAGGNVENFAIDPYNERVVYNADAETDGLNELYSAPVGGGGSIKLNPTLAQTLPNDAGITYFVLDPAYGSVGFIAREASEKGGSLYTIPTIGGSRYKLNLPLGT